MKHPVIPENPLMDFEGLPRFADFRAEHVGPAIEALLAQARAVLDEVRGSEATPTWDSFVRPLEDATERLGRAWGLVSHLNGVADSPELRAAYNESLPRVTEFWTELGQDRALFARYRSLRGSPEFALLSPERQRVIDNALRDFRLGGAELESPARERYAAIQERQAALAQKFSENVLDATKAFTLDVVDGSQLAGLPEDALAAAKAEAEAAGLPGWRFSLQFPSYFPVMQYAENRAIRETLYRAYVTRASESSDPALDNGPVIEELLALRDEESQLLGFSNFAQVSLERKMAESPQAVMTFLLDLARRARPSAERDVALLSRFARETLGIETLQAWDLAFASERLRQAQYDFSDQEVKQYFPLPRVLQGLFGLIERLFGARIAPDQAQGWHPEVQFFRIERDGLTIGHFYLDMFARPSKRPGAWMDDARGRRDLGAGLTQTPVAYLTCNIQAPTGDRPALLTHDEIITLFHEFGHGLHHMLTRVGELGVSGIAGVEWDAVELPSQFLENFCWEWEIVQSMSARIDTGAPLPRAIFDRMLAARNFQSGLQTLRQIEFALFDMRLHSQSTSTNPQIRRHAQAVQALLDEVRREVAVLRPPGFNRFQNSFSHIFAGGYAAGYYSYKWAEVLSADCYAAFEEEGVFNTATGQRFLQEILSVGGSRPAIESFRAFRGREPRLDALLRHHGMTDEAVLA